MPSRLGFLFSCFIEKGGLFKKSRQAVGLNCLSMLLLNVVGLITCQLKSKNRNPLKVDCFRGELKFRLWGFEKRLVV